MNSCEHCVHRAVNYYYEPPLHICTMTMKVFAVSPSSVPPCLGFKPKPEYIPKEVETENEH